MQEKLYQLKQKIKKGVERFKEQRKRRPVKEQPSRSFANHKKRGRKK